MKSVEQVVASILARISGTTSEYDALATDLYHLEVAARADERMQIRSKAHPLMVGADGKVQVWTVNDDDLRVPDATLDTP